MLNHFNSFVHLVVHTYNRIDGLSHRPCPTSQNNKRTGRYSLLKHIYRYNLGYGEVQIRI